MIYTATSKEFLTKTWANVDDVLQEIKTPFATEYVYTGVPCATLRDVADVHENLLAQLHTCVVLGVPKVGDGKRSSELFMDRPVEFMYWDLDSLPMRESMQATIIHALPFLKGKAFVWYYSASSGFKAGVRVRVICHTPPMTLSQQKFAAQQYDRRLTALIGRKYPDKPPTKDPQYIDFRLYSKGHVIYSARPRLLSVKDPHPQRVFYVDGDETPADLALPKTKTIKVPYATTQKPALAGDWASEGNRDTSMFKYISNLIRYHGLTITNDKIKSLWESEMDRLQVDSAVRNEFTKTLDYKITYLRNHVSDDMTLDVAVLDNDVARVPLEKAEASLRGIIDRTVDLFNSVSVINITPGVGKTTAVLQILAKRYAGKNDDPDDLNMWIKPTEYYLPTQEMCDQACEQALALGLKATVRRGRGREGMCFKHATDKKLHDIGEDAKDLLCKDEEHQCPEYDTCAYRQQFVDEQDAQIIFLPHSYLPLKRKIDFDKRRKPGLIVIDEAPWFGLVHLHEMKLADLRDRDTSPEFTEKFCDAAKDGITLEKLAAAGLTEEIFTTLRKAEKARRPQLLLNPAMDDQQSLAAVNRFDSKWFEYDRVWKLMERAMKEGHLRNVRVENKTLYMHWRSEIDAIPRNADGDMECPVVILDATAKREIVEAFLPVDEFHEIHADVHPDAKIEHVKEKASMTSRLYGIRGLKEETNEEKIADAKQARERDERLAAGKTMITYKVWDELSDNVHGHFGAIRGINKFEGQDLYVVGRTLPPPRGVERIAQAIIGRDIDWMAFGEWYPQRSLSTEQGFVESDYHPDPFVEAVRWMICEGEVEQAVHRARPVRHPVSITMVNNLPVRIRTSVERKLMQKEREFQAFVPLSEKERCVYGRDANRILKAEEARLYREAALVYAYRRPGARGPMSLGLARCAADIGEVEHIEVADHPYNDRVIIIRDFCDHVDRLPSGWEHDKVRVKENGEMEYLEWDFEEFSMPIGDLRFGRTVLTKKVKFWPWHVYSEDEWVTQQLQEDAAAD